MNALAMTLVAQVAPRRNVKRLVIKGQIACGRQAVARPIPATIAQGTTLGVLAADMQPATVFLLKVLIAIGKARRGLPDPPASAWEMIPAVVAAPSQFATLGHRRALIASGEVLSKFLALWRWLCPTWMAF